MVEWCDILDMQCSSRQRTTLYKRLLYADRERVKRLIRCLSIEEGDQVIKILERAEKRLAESLEATVVDVG